MTTAIIDRATQPRTPLASVNRLLDAEHEARRVKQTEADDACAARLHNAKQAIRVVLGELAETAEETGEWYDDAHSAPRSIAALQVRLPDIAPFTVKASAWNDPPDNFAVTLCGYLNPVRFCATPTMIPDGQGDIAKALASFLYDQCAEAAQKAQAKLERNVQERRAALEAERLHAERQKQEAQRVKVKAEYQADYAAYLRAFHAIASANRAVFETAAAEWLAPFPAWRLTYALVAGGTDNYSPPVIETATAISLAPTPDDCGQYPVFLKQSARIAPVAYPTLVSVENIGLTQWGKGGLVWTNHVEVEEAAQVFYHAPNPQAATALAALVTECREKWFAPLPDEPACPEGVSRDAFDVQREAMSAVQDEIPHMIVPSGWNC